MNGNTVRIPAEPALEPELAIIDTHHHLWAVLPDSIAIGRPYSIDEFHRDVRGGHKVIASVFVECSGSYRADGPEHLRPMGEIEWVLRQEGDNGLMSGLIGFANLQLGSKVGEVLDAYLALAGTRFKGVRHGVVWDPHPGVYVAPRKPPPHLLVDPSYRKGVTELARRDLVFEAWAYFHQLAELAELARTQPDVQIVLCHLGGPVAMGPYASRRDEMLHEWRRALSALARCPNVVMKLGAIGFPPFGAPEVLGPRCSSELIAEYWKPEIRFCIETFGPERCMFESNFPVDDALCDYVTLWNVFKRITSDLTHDERKTLFENTARRTYRL